MRKYYYLFIFLLVSCGGGGSSNNGQENSRQNTAPELVGLIDFAIDENTTQVATFTATDAEGDIINYSISGVDASLLSIGQSSGILVFRSAPDYEDPKDSDLDNILGVGPKLKISLIRHFGGVNKVYEASLDNLKAVPGIGDRKAREIYISLK